MDTLSDVRLDTNLDTNVAMPSYLPITADSRLPETF